MKVKTLIKKLQKLDPELTVYLFDTSDDVPFDKITIVKEEEVEYGEMLDPEKAKKGKHRVAAIQIGLIGEEE